MIANGLLIAAVSLICYAFYKWIRRYEDYFEKRGIPHMKPFFVFGNTMGFFMRRINIFDFVKQVYNKDTSASIYGLFDLTRPVFIVRDPEVLKQLAVKDFDHFEDHMPFINEDVDEMFGNSLFMLRGQKWRDMRATLSPAFTGSKMRQMFDLVTECAIDMTKHFRERAENGEQIECEMKEIFSRYTNDVIATTAFGIKVDSFKDATNEFLLTGKRFANLNAPINSIKFVLLRAIPTLMKKFKIELTDSRVKQFFQSMVLDNIKIREEKGIFRPDMINILMQVKKGQTEMADEEKTVDGFATVEESNIGKTTTKRDWTMNELVAQCFLFFIAGFDTSSTMLMFLFYELALNPEIQEKLYKEIEEMNKMLNGQNINYDNLQKMKYMDMVITEILRKWPPAGMVDRYCVKDYNYDDGQLKFKVEKGIYFWIPIYGLQNDPKYFPNPEKFDPERFSEENKHKIVPYSYIPFGVGPRNCIGSRFALMKLKAVVYYLLLDFKFIPNARTQIPLKFENTPFQVKTEKGVYLDMKLRTNL